MSSKAAIFAVFLIVACSPYLPPDWIRYYPTGANTAVVGPTSVLSSNDSLVFQTQLNFLDLEGHYDIGGIQQNELAFTSPGIYKIHGFSEAEISGVHNPAVMILEDESGNYDSLDPLNYRSKMINQAVQDIATYGSFIVGGYSTGGKINAPAEFGSSAFSSDWASQQTFIYGLSQKTGGKSSLYDALFNALTFFDQEDSGNKNIVVLAHATDAASASTAQTIIDNANTAHVKIHVLFLGDANNVGSLAQLSALTGGYLSVLTDKREMITTFAQLSRLISGDSHIYVLTVSYRPLSGGLTGDITHTLAVLDFTDGKYYNPLLIYTRLP